MICVRNHILLIAAGLILLVLHGCGPVTVSTRPTGHSKSGTLKPYTINGKTYYPIESADGYWERGQASWYGRQFHGRKTANGETYDMYGMTAAHKTLPMGTMLLVRNLDNRRETVVRVNDRGPFIKGRIIDLTYTAAQKINMIGPGVARVEIVALGEAPGSAKKGGPQPGSLKHQDFRTGNFFIQVGSFLEKNNAERVAGLFAKAGIRVVIQPYVTSGYTYYRVQVFAGNSLGAAKIFERQLVQRGYSGAFVISR